MDHALAPVPVLVAEAVEAPSQNTWLVLAVIGVLAVLVVVVAVVWTRHNERVKARPTAEEENDPTGNDSRAVRVGARTVLVVLTAVVVLGVLAFVIGRVGDLAG